jgi:hypothetical protein
MNLSAFEHMLHTGVLLTGPFPPTAPPPDLPPPEIKRSTTTTKRLPPPRIVAAGTDDPVTLQRSFQQQQQQFQPMKLPDLGVPKFTLSDYGPIPSFITVFVNDGKPIQYCGTTPVKEQQPAPPGPSLETQHSDVP